MPRQRIILLGASNLTRALPRVVNIIQQRVDGPTQIFAALGRGRSYGMRSSLAFGLRGLPSILECGLWDALKSPREGDQPHALITDIGNDIMYGAAPQVITDWVKQCIDRLQSHDASIAMTMVPIETLRRVKRWQFQVVKAVMFPTRRLQFDEAIAKAGELHDRIAELAQRTNVRIVTPRADWYGFDPIHIKRRHWAQAWNEKLAACFERPVVDASRSLTPIERLRLLAAMPQRWWLGPVQMNRKQPVQSLEDGTTISLF